MPHEKPIPLLFRHVESMQTRYEGSSGSIRVSLQDGSHFDLEMVQRPGNPPGILIRGLDCALEVVPEVSNVVIVKPRGSR